jgi:shikimate dehydrogenase
MIQNAWLSGAGLDAVYVAFPVAEAGLAALLNGFRGGVLTGVNVTLPFKAEALALCDRASPRALAAGAANLILFEPDGTIVGDNTDGAGLLAAFAEQAPTFDVAARPAVILGAGGAARGAAAALLAAGIEDIRLVNRTGPRADAIQALLGSKVQTFTWAGLGEAFSGAGCVINATSLGLEGHAPLDVPLEGLPKGAVVMDMVYRPLRTAFLARAQAEGFTTVDGLAMLIGQAAPSFEALFGQAPPDGVDVRAMALSALGAVE